MAFLDPRPSSNSLGNSTGHVSTHSPQPVHFSPSTKLAFFFTFILKLPALPETSSSSE